MSRLYLSLILAFIALGLAGFVFWRYFYLGTLVLDLVPTQATVTLNGVAVPDRTLHLRRGTYEVTVSAPGYRNESFTHTSSLGRQANKRLELVSLPRPKLILDGAISSVATNAERTHLFFVKDHTLYRLNLAVAGQPAQAITPKLAGIVRVDWSPDFALAILYKTNGEVGLYDFNRYDLLNQSYKVLGQTITATTWEADGSAYYYLNQLPDGTNLLVKADRSGTDIARYDHIGVPAGTKVTLVSGPANQVLITGTDRQRPNDIIVSDNYTRTITPLTTSQNAFAPVLSPSKKYLAYLENGELVVATAAGKDRRNTNLRPRANSYAFVSETSLAVLTANMISLINPQTGETTSHEVYAPDDTITALIASADGKVVSYVYKGNLFALPLGR